MTNHQPPAGGDWPGVERRRERRVQPRQPEAGADFPRITPTTETLEVLRGRLPLSIRLIGRSSVPGALVVLAVVAVFLGAVPLAAKLQLNAAQSAGEVIPVGNVIDVTVANDWRVESQDGRATVLDSGSSHLVITPAFEDARSARTIAAAEISVVEADGTGAWVVGEPVTFLTESRYPAASVAATSDTTATQVWAVTYQGLATIAVLSTTLESWNSASAGVEEMIESLVFDVPALGSDESPRVAP